MVTLTPGITITITIHGGGILTLVGGTGLTPADGILDEDGTTFLVAEDGATFIIHE